MNISFTNPLLAWGALAALLPVIIHLLQRRRPRPHPFAAIELVLRSQRRNVRRLRLRRLLLLAARTLLLLCIPLALARPHFVKESAAAAAPAGPAATAIVLDASLSMQWKDGRRSNFEIGQEEARKALSDLLVEEPVTWVICDGSAPVAPAPTFDRAAARRAIDEARASFRGVDLSACFGAAAQALGESPVPGKRIVLITDLAASAWRLDAPLATVPTEQGEVQPELRIVDVASGKALPNAAVVDLRVEPAPEVGARAHAFTVTLRNFGEEAISDRPLELRIGDEVVAKSFVEIPPGGSATKRLVHRFPQGGDFRGAVRLAADKLTADDERAFSLKVPRDLRALVVDGAPSPVRYRDEAFFVETALRAGGGVPIALQTVDAESLPTQDLGAYDLVWLLNVRAPDRAMAERLQAFVEAGGGLFISLGDQVDADAYNESMGRLLPRPLHVVKSAADPERTDQLPARFGQLDLLHPVLRIFDGSGQEGFHGARTYRYFLLQPGKEGQVLASFDDGAPALVEGTLGAGRVLLYTSTVDRDWGDWPIQSSFLPAIRQIAGYLAHALDERRSVVLVVGGRQQVDLPEGMDVVRVLGPDGKELPFRAGEEGGIRLEARLPGLHRVEGKVEGDRQEEAAFDFVAVVDPAESDTRRLDPAELRALFGKGGEAVETVAPAARPKRDTPLWSLLAALAIAAFLGEGLLIRK